MSNPDEYKKIKEMLARHQKRALPEGEARESESERAWAREILDGLEEKNLTLDELSEDALKRLVAASGMDTLIEVLTRKNDKAMGDAVKQDNTTKVAGKIGWVRPLALAAAVGLVVTAGIIYMPNNQTGPNDGSPHLAGPVDADGAHAVNLEIDWDDLPSLEVFGSWHALPDSVEETFPLLDAGGAVTLGGGSSEQRNQLKMSTVIVRSDSGFGSGVIADAEGWIISNYHVVETEVQAAALRGETAQVEIILPQLVDGRVRGNPNAVAARVMRVDPTADLALIKISDAVSGLRAAGIASIHPEEGEEVIVVGSPAGQPAWQVRYADVTSVFQFPEELSQHVAQPGTAPAVFDRERPQVVQTTADISYGDSGGPLFNENGEVVAITFATPSNLSSGSVGFHVALPHVLELMTDLPSEPEVVPPDIWTGASSGSQRQGPTVEPSGDGGSVASVRFIFRPVRKHPLDDMSRTTGEPSAVLQFVDQKNRLAIDHVGENGAELMPTGLWKMEDQGGFNWTFAVLQIRNGLTLAAYTGESGRIDEIRVGRSPHADALLIYRQNVAGVWSVQDTEQGPDQSVLKRGLTGSGAKRSLEDGNKKHPRDESGKGSSNRGPNVIR